MMGIPPEFEPEILNAVEKTGKSLVSRTEILYVLENNPGKYSNILRVSRNHRKQMVSVVMNLRFPKAVGKAWVIS